MPEPPPLGLVCPKQYPGRERENIFAPDLPAAPQARSRKCQQEASLILYAVFLCMYWHQPNMQDTCHVMSPPQVLFTHDDCEAYLSHSGMHDSVKGKLRSRYLCGESAGIPGHTLVCRANMTSCKLYTTSAEFPEEQEPTGSETGRGE
jgi:hypothetical protein